MQAACGSVEEGHIPVPVSRQGDAHDARQHEADRRFACTRPACNVARAIARKPTLCRQRVEPGSIAAPQAASRLPRQGISASGWGAAPDTACGRA